MEKRRSKPSENATSLRTTSDFSTIPVRSKSTSFLTDSSQIDSSEVRRSTSLFNPDGVSMTACSKTWDFNLKRIVRNWTHSVLEGGRSVALVLIELSLNSFALSHLATTSCTTFSLSYIMSRRDATMPLSWSTASRVKRNDKIESASCEGNEGRG